MDNTKKPENNIHSYIINSKSSFDETGFNEIDGLIMAQIANMKLENLGIDLYSGKSKTFEEIYREMISADGTAKTAYNAMDEDYKQLIKELGTSPRFKDMSVSNYVKNPSKSNIDGFPSVGKEQHMEQFAAVTITYEQNGETYNYVSYQATDASSNGWSENLAMLYCEDTQAQADSSAYMNIIAGMKDGYITGGGHSKGGNDFEYAYLFCNDDVRSRIVKGYVYDNPGINEQNLNRTTHYEEYLEITKGSFICPQDSIIGMLLHEADNAVFVHSTESGVFEHDPFTWEINLSTNTFVPDEQTDLSKKVNIFLDELVAGMDQGEKEALFAFISYLMYENNSGKEGIEGLQKFFTEGFINDDGSLNKLKVAQALFLLATDYFSLPPEQREDLRRALGYIVATGLSAGFEYLKESVEKWVEEKAEAIKNKLETVWNFVSDQIEDKIKIVKMFLDNIYVSVVEGLKTVAEWIRTHSAGYRYSSSHPVFTVDTYKMRDYADRLAKVNRRLVGIDDKMDSLYLKVGWSGLKHLIAADMLTGYSWRLDRAAAYLRDTASDFDSVENELKNTQ